MAAAAGVLHSLARSEERGVGDEGPQGNRKASRSASLRSVTLPLPRPCAPPPPPPGRHARGRVALTAAPGAVPAGAPRRALALTHTHAGPGALGALPGRRLQGRTADRPAGAGGRGRRRARARERGVPGRVSGCRCACEPRSAEPPHPPRPRPPPGDPFPAPAPAPATALPPRAALPGRSPAPARRLPARRRLAGDPHPHAPGGAG